MTIELFSKIVTLELFLLTAILAVCVFFYSVIPAFRKHVEKHTYTQLYGAMAGIVLASIFGALMYQIVYLTPVCELCWWQRIFLFPIAIVAMMAAIYKTREAYVTIVVMATIGLFYASYHYYLHFQGLVLNNPLAVPCSSGGLLPACGDSPILTFGFVTIPFMGILVFINLLMLAFFVHKKRRGEVQHVIT